MFQSPLVRIAVEKSIGHSDGVHAPLLSAATELVIREALAEVLPRGSYSADGSAPSCMRAVNRTV